MAVATTNVNISEENRAMMEVPKIAPNEPAPAKLIRNDLFSAVFQYDKACQMFGIIFGMENIIIAKRASK